MAFGNRPVASLSRRAVYKTEFDIFKRNTDIDLISLISFEDPDPRRLDNYVFTSRPQTVPVNTLRPSRSTEITTRARVSKGNNLLSAYDPTNKLKRQEDAFERERRRNSRNKETRIYKDFAKTTRDFLKRRQEDFKKRKTAEQARNCKSALSVRKHSDNRKAPTRSQTTCAFRTNDSNWINDSRSNRTAVSNANTTRLKQKDQVNKSRGVWRTKSAPATSNNIDNYQQKRKQDIQDLFRQDEEEIEETHSPLHIDGCIESLAEDVDCFNENSEREIITQSDHTPEEDIQNSFDGGLEFCLSDSRAKRYDTATWLENWRENTDVEKSHVTCIVVHDDKGSTEVAGEKKQFLENTFPDDSNESYTDTVNDDCIKSRDSGFSSNNATPELGFSVKYPPGHRDFDDSHKQVTFKVDQIIEETETEEIDFYGGDKIIKENEKNVDDAETNGDAHYDVNDLIRDLERFGATSRLSVLSAGCQSSHSVDGDNDSLFGEKALKALKESQEAEEKNKIEEEKKSKSPKDLESFVMSREARHAILETLYDMGGLKNKGKMKSLCADDIRHRSIGAQKRQKENRNKYEHFMRERTKSMLKNQFRSLDSAGNDDASSAFSSPRDVRECDDESDDDYPRGKMFPSIRENTKLSKDTDNSRTNNVKAEKRKKTKYKIPGIGNYQLVESEENDFEITPPGFDSRYARPIISKEEKEEVPPKLIREKSIQKCKNWLNNVSMSPMSLQPVNYLK